MIGVAIYAAGNDALKRGEVGLWHSISDVSNPDSLFNKFLKFKQDDHAAVRLALSIRRKHEKEARMNKIYGAHAELRRA